MKSMRTKILGSLAAVLLFASFGLFAGAASAAKIYTMVVQSTGANTVAVTIHNVTPENNSTINSFVINKPSGSTSLAPLSSSATANVVPDASGNIRVSGFDGLKSANRNPNSITINLTVNWTGGTPVCGSAVNWTSIAYTGNFSSTTFQLVSGSNNTVNISSVPMSLNCFTLTALPETINAGTSNKTFTALLTNLNGAGGPSISSLTVGASTAGVTASAAAISPALAPGLSTSVVVTVSTACGATAGNWSASASGPGPTAFAAGTITSATYAVNACKLTFNPGPPSSVGLKAAIKPAMVIEAKDGEGNPLAWNGSVTWGLVPQGTEEAGSVSGDSTPTCVNLLPGGACSAYSFDDVKITSGTVGGSYKLTGATSIGTAAGPTTATSLTAFTLWGGILGCDADNYKAGDLDPGALVTYVKSSDQGKWGLVRGNNKDTEGCKPVPYIFDLNINPLLPRQLASFIVPNPSDTGQKVAAEYVVVWGRVAVDAAGDETSWTTKRPKLSWGTTSAPIPGTNDYVPALSCVLDPDNPDLASTYPNGFRSVPTGQLDSLLPFIPNVAPFNALSPTLYPQYQPGQKASMCIAQQGWTAVGTNSSGKTLIQYWTRVIDQADGFMSLDN